LNLALIAFGQAAGFSLNEVGTMLVEQQVDRQLLMAKANELDARIERVQAISKGLRHAAQCPEEDHLACSKFQLLMKLAAGHGKTGPIKLCVETAWIKSLQACIACTE